LVEVEDFFTVVDGAGCSEAFLTGADGPGWVAGCGQNQSIVCRTIKRRSVSKLNAVSPEMNFKIES
jgi:hypothetical protein